MRPIIRRMLCAFLLLCLLPVTALGESSSAVQIRNGGGSAARDGVTLSKTIHPTQTENLFDITLQIETTHSLEKLLQAEDAAVVLVMDISATMNQKLEGETGPTRLDAAKEAAGAFVSAFSDPHRLLGAERELGFVTFNRDAHTLFALDTVSPENEAAWQEAISAMTAPTSASGLGWTNIEAGLLLARNLLAESSAKHRFIILLTDGFPTTYITSDADEKNLAGIAGRDPTSGFRDAVKNVECTMGTSYSETAAQRARAAASAIRESGVDVFSIGVGIGSPIEVAGQWVPETIQAHIDRITWNASVVERPAAAAAPDYVYEIGAADDPDSYRCWLGGKTENGGIGGGPNFASDSSPYGAYADANDPETLANIFDSLLSGIEIINQNAIRDTWIASDPMGSGVEFLYFLNAGENAVSFADDTLSWDLFASPHTTVTEDGVTRWIYTLHYRVRLKNELPSFQSATTEDEPSEPAYLTNGNADLHYKVEVNGQLSDDRVLAFAQPTVEGYLGTLRFVKKTTETGGAHGGVTFTLAHRNDCSVCGGSVEVAPVTGVSGADGQTVLSSIPSGHQYHLTENGSQGYVQREYGVEVSYGQTVLCGADGRPTDTIVNELLPGELVLTARKLLDGTAPESGQFSFLLLSQQGEVLQSRPCGENGVVVFDPLVFTVPGTYVYRIRELVGQQSDILFDPAVYTVTVEARKTEKGCEPEIIAVEKEQRPHGGEVLFENRTKPQPTETPEPSNTPTNTPEPSPTPVPTGTPASLPTPTPSRSPVPKTGDGSLPGLWMVLAVLSAAGAILLLVWRSRNAN